MKDKSQFGKGFIHSQPSQNGGETYRVFSMDVNQHLVCSLFRDVYGLSRANTNKQQVLKGKYRVRSFLLCWSSDTLIERG